MSRRVQADVVATFEAAADRHAPVHGGGRPPGAPHPTGGKKPGEPIPELHELALYGLGGGLAQLPGREADSLAAFRRVIRVADASAFALAADQHAAAAAAAARAAEEDESLLHLLTVATEERPELDTLRESCAAAGVELTVLGMGQVGRWVGR
jgi:hypothetical protein